MHILLLFLTIFCTPLFAAQVDTFYGPIEVEEPVLLELIESPSFQRLKSIHQYGVSYYTTHREEYTRYEHSLGVFAILRAKNAPLEEQIAGLLHDVSHTVFSHVGDWLFGKEYQEKDYQNCTHRVFLQRSGIETILGKYNLTCEQVMPLEELFPMLEQRGPSLCADRIDYNIQGAFYQNWITYDEALEIFDDVQFIEGNWISTKCELMKKLVRFSLFMTQNCWGSPTNYLSSRWLADALLRSVDIGSISLDEIHFGKDQEIWEQLIASRDPIVRKKMDLLLHTASHFSEVDPTDADLIVKTKFRGIDPWIAAPNAPVRLTSLDPLLLRDYQTTQAKVEKGWAIKLRGN